MPIYINKENQQTGPYEDHVIIEQLKNGLLSPNDMAIRHGDASWRRLGDIFPDAGPADAKNEPTAFASPAAGGVVASTVPGKKKGGCLKGGLIGLGLLLLLLGIITAAGSRFIPSPSCDLVEADERKIRKLESDIEKAKSDNKYDRIGPLALELKETLAGAETSRRYCNDDKFRNDLIAGGGAAVGVLGLLMAVAGLFVGRRK
jgi:hypothetical protein